MGTKLKICAAVFLVFLIGQACHAYVKTFRCSNNGKYIRDEFFCDGDRDCPRREDEGYFGGANSSCKRGTCGKGKFACDKNQCKNITVRCNTLQDCVDGTDELNCGDEINVHNCTSKGKFLCKDGLRCLDLDLTCNKDCNCFDCSDENSNCTKRDPDLLSRCPNAYYVGGNGPVCLCDLTTDNETSTLCTDIETCPGYYDCDQHCIKFKSTRFCTCYDGFHSTDGSDGSKCKSDEWYKNAIIYSTMLKIKVLNMTTNTSTVIQDAVHMCTALSAAHDYVYYATVSSDSKAKLFKAPISYGAADVIAEIDSNITSIAPDYITNNVYFTSNGTLSVCSNDGRICREIKCCNIRFVVAAPKSGWLFYLQSIVSFGRPAAVVLRSNMDGSNETYFADDVYYGVEFSLVIDESKSKLYVLAANNYNKMKVDLISFGGEFEETVTVTNFHSLSVLNGDLFVTTDDANDILYTPRFRRLRSINDETDLYFRDSKTSSAKYLYAFNALLQKKTQDPCAKSACSGLCLVKSAISSNSGLSYTCICNGFTPTSDNHWCTDHHAQAASHSTVWILISVLVLITLAGSGYYVYTKTNWYDYYLALRRWEQNRRDQRIIISNEE